MALQRRHAMRFVGLVILLLFTAFFFVPIIWLFLAPTKTDGQLLTESPFAFGSLARSSHTFHRIITYDDDSLLIWLKNSAIYSFGGTALAIVAAIPAGYGLALTHFIGRRALLSITLVVMIMPATALVLPLFLEINKLGLYGTIWSLILPFGFFPFGVYLAYIYFSSTIPKDLLAAARIDGASEWGVFRYIALPLARPIVGLVGVLRLRRVLEQLLPSVRDDLRQLAISASDRAAAADRLDRVVQSRQLFGWQQRRGSPPAGPRHGSDHGDRSGAHGVPIRAARPCHGHARRCDQGVTGSNGDRLVPKRNPDLPEERTPRGRPAQPRGTRTASFSSSSGPPDAARQRACGCSPGSSTSTTASILIDDKDVIDLPPRDRDIAMVFQNYALYPHMNVAQNMGVLAEDGEGAEGRDRRARPGDREDPRARGLPRAQAAAAIRRSAPAGRDGSRDRPRSRVYS